MASEVAACRDTFPEFFAGYFDGKASAEKAGAERNVPELEAPPATHNAEHVLALAADHNDAVATLTSQREALARRLQDQVTKLTAELEAALEGFVGVVALREGQLPGDGHEHHFAVHHVLQGDFEALARRPRVVA